MKKPVFYLTDDFNKASELFIHSMVYLEKKIIDQGVKGSIYAPSWDHKKWHNQRSNCYNYAVNRNTKDKLQPGELSKGNIIDFKPEFDEDLLASAVHHNVQADGLVYLGMNFEPQDIASSKGLAALFISGSRISIGNGLTPSFDFHWAALRRDHNSSKDKIVWSHKQTSRDPEICVEDFRSENTNLFLAMSQKGYPIFAGYYSVPKSLAKPV
jgi:hypothetical protein